MRQAIQTKYLGPTNTRGARIKAECYAKTIIIGWDHALNPEQNHIEAARQLQERLGWLKFGPYHGGQLKDGSYVFVQVEVSK